MPYSVGPSNPIERYRGLWPGWPDAAYASIFYDSFTGDYFFRGTDGQIRRMPPQGAAFPQAWSNILGGGGITTNQGNFPSTGSPGYQPPSQQNWPGGNMPTDFGYGYDPLGGSYGGGYGPLSGGGNNYGDGGYGGTGGGQQGGFFESFLGQSLLNAGMNFIGGYLQDRATGKANKANQEAIRQRIMQALAELSPAQIGSLARAFMPEVMQQLGPLQQTALQGLATTQARQGLAGTPYGLTAEAGLRGYNANQSSSEAFRMAMNLAGSRASAITGMPFSPQQPQAGIANAFSNTARQGLDAYAFIQAARRPTQGTPYIYGNQASLQDPYGTQQMGGTPWRWPFNPGRY